MNVVPAVWLGLFGLLALSERSTMSALGPAASGSAASSRPPGAPSSRSAASTFGVCRANAGNRNMRPKCCAAAEPAWAHGACAAAGPGAATAPTGSSAMAPALAPTAPRNRRRLSRWRWSSLIAAPLSSASRAMCQ